MLTAAHRALHCRLTLAVLANGGCAPSASPAQPNDAPGVEQSQPVKQPAITISKETTHLLATSNGFLLYSVGMNGSDDGGQTYGSGDGADDLVVSAP